MIVSLLTSRTWLTGFALMLAGLACQTVVLTFEPVSVVQPVLASGVVLVLVLSRLSAAGAPARRGDLVRGGDRRLRGPARPVRDRSGG